MKFIRFKQGERIVSALITSQNEFVEIGDIDYVTFYKLLKENQWSAEIYIDENQLERQSNIEIYSLDLVVPIEADEVWASGVTYLQSKHARNYEATDGKLNSETFYDKVYDAPRPEIFMKSTKRRTVGPNDNVYIRRDSNWQIPEPELGLVIGEGEEIIGFTLGNDMSCRDIEGENPLYLPQAKVWKNSCALGPAILLPEAIDDPYSIELNCKIYRDGKELFTGSASVSQLKRKLEELVHYLVYENDVIPGTVLLTGTCIVPPNSFTLEIGDEIVISSTQIGTLKNKVYQNQ
ncbi:fumarylacetoacetate hydrolase family protein [Ureibacillus chungkukjangi]|uniref:2-dehydro-3-deoxy-D-arabinonate dehydratase n=1 Tax=Ureibacillus chungkukjangi TaxID=1202712 RepID=A0A318TK92_9BACL|nr:fumarylacetoacetate hydrolase family protein [Ureibacillus chungkukjangi]MCM3387031.1 fumarylacetoacetate hydrolase family protein [Ureibacillus chungkukjangi]PYF05232.1 2-dehydro-3-deoxy-D-arabinonate dehydratase [Ureibacillus chungkukjangi]